MLYAALTPAEKKKVTDWIERGFDQFIALRVASDTSNPDREQDCAHIRRYKDVFVDILKEKATDREGDLPELLRDLYRLMSRGCPALDLVELMYGATSGINPTFRDALRYVGLNERKLSDLSLVCERMANVISMLHGRLLPGPFFPLPRVLPKNANPEQVQHQIEQLPDLLRLYATLLRNRQPLANPWLEDFSKQPDLVILAFLLDYFRRNRARASSIQTAHWYRCCPTLGRLLRTMRQVRHIISPDAKYLHSFERSNNRDPFSEIALQKRLNRFFSEEHHMVTLMMETVRAYFSDEWAEHRRRGETLPILVGQIWEKILRPYREETAR